MANINSITILDRLKKISVIKFFFVGHERSINIYRNIAGSFLLRGIGVIISFIQLPITLHYLNPTKYGIWVTLSSIVAWFQYFDIGLGNGLRNKFAEALAKNDKVLARTYVSTSYFMVGIITLIIYLLFLIINPFLNWAKILNTSIDWAIELNQLVHVVFLGFCISFFLQLINKIIVADQKPAVLEMMNVASSILTLIIIIILTKTTNGSLLYLGIGLSFVPIIVYLVTSIYFFAKNYKDFIPSFKFIEMKYARNLTTLGIKFFIIQVAGVVLFSTNNIIITQVVGPSEVTPYSISYKYFDMLTMLFMIIATPFWSSFTDSYYKKDYEWIKSSMKKLKKIAVVFIGLAIIMLSISDLFFKFWIGKTVNFPFILLVFVALNVIIMTWGTQYSLFINGVGKIKLQLYVASFMAIINIPLSIFLAKFLYLGSSGVVLATCLCNFPAMFLWQMQYNKIMSNKASGIWNQ